MIVAIVAVLHSLYPIVASDTIPIKKNDIPPINISAIPKLDKFIVFYVLYETALRFRGDDRGLVLLSL
jgi:hypothetical protein